MVSLPGGHWVTLASWTRQQCRRGHGTQGSLSVLGPGFWFSRLWAPRWGCWPSMDSLGRLSPWLVFPPPAGVCTALCLVAAILAVGGGPGAPSVAAMAQQASHAGLTTDQLP